MSSATLPPDLAVLAGLVDARPPEMREVFHYAVVMLLVEDGKATIVERRTIDARECIYIRTSAGELFSMVKPDVGEEALAHLRELAREALCEGRTGEDDGGQEALTNRFARDHSVIFTAGKLQLR